MHEIRVTVPAGSASSVAQIARRAGIKQASVYSIYSYGPDEAQEVVSVEVPTPEAKSFLDALLADPGFDSAKCSISSRELRAILSRRPAFELTQPMIEPTVDVFEDLWQLSHVTRGYIGRAVSGAVLLAYGMLKGNPIAIVVAALFLPFLSQVLALSYGLSLGEWALARQGMKALLVSTIATILAGMAVAAVAPGPIRFAYFDTPLVGFAISCFIGIAAGLSSADDAGRRYLIGVAAAVQFAVFPAWFGLSVMHGFGSSQIVLERLGTFAINVITIAGSAAIAYGSLGLKREDIQRFTKHTRMRG